jgi:hypothetical protein
MEKRARCCNHFGVLNVSIYKSYRCVYSENVVSSETTECHKRRSPRIDSGAAASLKGFPHIDMCQNSQISHAARIQKLSSVIVINQRILTASLCLTTISREAPFLHTSNFCPVTGSTSCVASPSFCRSA